MKTYLSFLFIVLLLSCTKSIYHVASVQSEQVKPVATDFVFENEELRLVYNFWEPGGRLRFLLFNKTDKPLYIDWTKSILVRNDVKTLYGQLPPLPKRGYVDTVRYTYQTMLAQPYRITHGPIRSPKFPRRPMLPLPTSPFSRSCCTPKPKKKYLPTQRKILHYGLVSSWSTPSIKP